MTWKATVIVTGATALVGWLASPYQPTPAAGPAAPAARPAQAAAASDIEEQAARLQARLRTEAAFREPSRDPFRFEERSVQATPRVEPEHPRDALDSSVRPQGPMLTLSGLASDVVDGVTTRTAILAAPDGVVLVTVGDTVGGIYRVAAIEEEAVELVGIADGQSRWLRLAGAKP